MIDQAIATIFSPPFAAGFAQIMTWIIGGLLVVSVVQGVRDRAKRNR